ncbi:hypothetical protein BU15DRAFT_80162 [Melanogaster broomeanus]|nr:hypothetical protein BU15DRAFT_80162 [Melanogaster broomeanus]
MSNTSNTSVDPIPKPLMTISAHEEAIQEMAYLPGGERIVTRSGDKTIKLWNVENGEQEGRSMEHEGPGKDERIRVWDVETQECIEEWEGDPGSINCIAISPDGQFVGSSVPEGNILVREMKEGGQIKHSLKGASASYSSLCFSPNGEKLASCSFLDDNGILIFDVESGELILGPMGYKYTQSVIWSLDGTQLFSAHGNFGSNNEIRCWNCENGELIGEPWTGHTNIVSSLSLSPDGTKIASASFDRTVCFWDAHSGDPIHQPLLHQSSLLAVTFSPSGEFVAAGDYDGTVSIWRVPWWDESQKKVYDSFLDVRYPNRFAPAILTIVSLSSQLCPLPRLPWSIHAQDEFDFHIHPPTSRPLGRSAPIVPLVQHLWRGLVARDSPSSPTEQTTEGRPTSQERRFWKSPVRTPVAAAQLTQRVVVARSRRKRRKEKKHHKSHEPSQPPRHTDPSNVVAGPSSSHAEPPGAPPKVDPSTPQAGPSISSKPAPELRTSSFVQSHAASDDSWDDMDGCGKCLDYFCGGPRPDRERFRPWRKKSPAVYDSFLDLPAVPAPKAPLSIHAQDEFDFRDTSTRPTSRPLGRSAPIVPLVQHLWRGLVARDSPSSPTEQTTEGRPTSQERRFWKSPVRTPVAAAQLTQRVVVARSRRKRRKEKKHHKSHEPSQPPRHTDPSNVVAGPSSSHAEPPGAPPKVDPSTPQAGPSISSKPAPELRTSSFVQSHAASDDSWDDMDGCGKCLDYFCGGPRPDRERFRPWRKKSPAVIEAEQQLREGKRRVRRATEMAARKQKGHASPDEATFEHLGDSPVGGAATRHDILQLQEQIERIRRQHDDEAAARRKAEAERDGLQIAVMELRRMSHKSPEPLECQSHPVVELDASSSFAKPSSTSNASKGHDVHPPHHQDSQWDHTKAASQPPPHAEEATPGCLGDSQVDWADPQRGILQLQEQIEVIHRQLETRRNADAEMDRLQKEIQELRDITHTSRKPLDRQTHSGLSVVEAGPSSAFAEPSCSTSNAGPSTSSSRSSTSSSDPEGS